LTWDGWRKPSRKIEKLSDTCVGRPTPNLAGPTTPKHAKLSPTKPCVQNQINKNLASFFLSSAWLTWPISTTLYNSISFIQHPFVYPSPPISHSPFTYISSFSPNFAFSSKNHTHIVVLIIISFHFLVLGVKALIYFILLSKTFDGLQRFDKTKDEVEDKEEEKRGGSSREEDEEIATDNSGRRRVKGGPAFSSDRGAYLAVEVAT